MPEEQHLDLFEKIHEYAEINQNPLFKKKWDEACDRDKPYEFAPYVIREGHFESFVRKLFEDYNEEEDELRRIRIQ